MPLHPSVEVFCRHDVHNVRLREAFQLMHLSKERHFNAVLLHLMLLLSLVRLEIGEILAQILG